MTQFSVKELKQALVTASCEVFRVRDDEVHLADRQNLQLMEAGVRARAGEHPVVTVVLRAQTSDAPGVSATALLDLVRTHAVALNEAGFAETAAASREIRSVSDAARVLDVWHEVTLQRPVQSLEEAVAETRRALAADRYVRPDGATD